MLRKLLQREWVLNRTNVVLMFAIYAAFQIYMVNSMEDTRPWFVMATLYAAVLTSALIVREDKFRSTWWACVLPVTRLELIRARYVASWAMVVGALIGSILLAAFTPGSNMLVSEIFNPWTLLIAATAITGVLAWVLPFAIRFGMLGMMIFLVGGQVAGVGLLVLGRMTQRGGAGGERPIRSALAAISDAILGAREAMTPVLFAIAVVVMLTALNWLSYRFAALMFGRREF